MDYSTILCSRLNREPGCRKEVGLLWENYIGGKLIAVMGCNQTERKNGSLCCKIKGEEMHQTAENMGEYPCLFDPKVGWRYFRVEDKERFEKKD